MISELKDYDLSLVASRLPADVMGIVKKHGLIVAGGFIRSIILGERPNDIDIWGKSQAILETAANELAAGTSGARVHETMNAYTVLRNGRTPVQFIFRWVFDEPKDCVDSFDFTIASAAIYWDSTDSSWQSITHKDFYPDLAAKRLTYLAPERDEEAGGSMIRVMKYVSRGYKISAPSLAKVIARLTAKVDSNRINISDQEAVAMVIAGELRSVDPLVVVDGCDIAEERFGL